MRVCPLLLVLFFTTLTSGVATGIDELLGRASAVVEGAVMNSQVSGSATTLQIEVSSVLLGSVRHQGTGTFVSSQKVERDDVERQRQLDQIVSEFVARASAAGFKIEDVLTRLQEITKRNPQ